MSSARRKLQQRGKRVVEQPKGPDERAREFDTKLFHAVAASMSGPLDHLETSIIGSCLMVRGVDALLHEGFGPEDIKEFLDVHLSRLERARALGLALPSPTLLLPAGPGVGPATTLDEDKP